MKKTHFLLLSFLLLLLVDDVNAQLKLGDQPTSVQKSVILDLQGSNGRQGVWLPRVSDTTDATGIDGLNPPNGVLIYHTPSASVMIRKNGFWNSVQTTTKVGSTTSTSSVIEFQLGTTAGSSKDVNYTLNSSTGVITLNIPDAAVDTRGLVSIGSQTFGGLKTFNDGLTSSSTTTISGVSSNASNLYLGITSTTTPGTTTDRFLSVDNSGRVVLSQGIPSTRTMTINGTSYDLSANRTWNVGTLTSLTGGYGLNGGTITSSGTLSIDTSAISTRAWRQKGIDSLAALINGYVPSTRTINGLALSFNHTFSTGSSGTDFNIVSGGSTHTFNIPTASASNRGLLSSADWTTFNSKVSTSRTITINGTTQDLSANRTWSVGTVTSVAGGYGLNGGTITATGTLSLDTTAISTRAWRQKGIDSVVSLINGFVPATRTINGLALSANQTFATGTSGTNFNISSSGTTHTFNLPDASSTARGVITTGTQTFAGLKTFSTGVTVTGATSNASNLTLGITSATTPGTATTDNVLTVNSSGTVTLNPVAVTAPTGATKIKNYSVTIGSLPNSLSGGSTTVYTFTVSGGGLSTSSTVVVSPASDLKDDVTINWARVSSATTIKVSMTNNGSGNQPFTNSSNATFNFTVIEF